MSDLGTDDQQVCGTCGQPESLVCAEREPAVGELSALDAESLDRAMRLLSAAELENGEPMPDQIAWFHDGHVPMGWRALDADATQPVEG